jgi:hypothetical protein
MLSTSIRTLTPFKHLVVDVTVTRARTNSNVPGMGASLPLPCSPEMRAQQAKMDDDLRTSSSLGTASIFSVHVYYPFALEDRGRLAPTMAVDLVDCLAILVAARRFPSMGAADSRCLRYESFCPHEGVRTAVYICSLPSISWGRALWGYATPFFIARWVPIFVMPCMRVVEVLLPASLLRGLRLLCMFSFLLYWLIPFLSL